MSTQSPATSTARLFHPLLRVILFLMLAVTPLATAFALPSSALAAPAAQGSETAEGTLVYYYESEVVADGTNEVVVSVYFYDDDTFELYLDFQDGEDPSMATG